MEGRKLAALEPARVFAWFEKLCAIPHGSRNTRAISDYLVAFASEHKLRCIQDAADNVILFVDASAGYESHPSVILQGHMDMVCEKDAACPIDMRTEGLRVTHDGTFVYAEGTTLGGDDGIAVAYALALAEDPAIPHPPLEIVITADEEIGMLGADAIDLSMLRGRTLINLDSEDEGVFTVACAGGATATLSLPAPRRVVYGPCVRLTVRGLRGGHSGAEIHKNRANANKLMGELLRRVRARFPLCLSALSGGAKDNAIPRECTATLVAMGTDIAQIHDVAQALQDEVRARFDEPDAVICGDDADAFGGNALSVADTDKVIELLCAVPNGVQAMSESMPALVQTSLNLGIAKLGGAAELTLSVRSSVNAEKEALLLGLRELARACGADYAQAGEYPAWEYRQDSSLRETMVRIYGAMFGAQPQIVAIHAGLECGLLSRKLEGLDCVSIGPQMYDIHTSREKLEIASVARTWRFLLEVLKAL